MTKRELVMAHSPAARPTGSPLAVTTQTSPRNYPGSAPTSAKKPKATT